MGTEVFDCLAELSRVTGSNLNPKMALVCANESFMWNQAKCFCRVKYLVDSPIKYALFRKQVSSPPKRLFINEENENCEIPNSLGRKCPLKEMSKYQCGIAELDYKIPEFEGNKNYLNSFVPWYPPLPASSSSSSLNNECYKDARNISSSSSPCSTSSPFNPCSTSSFLQPTYQLLLKSMCVPNWVLLYFKLQAKLPDAARLGRCGIKDLLWPA